MSERLRDRGILVTGAARGIGAALARQLAGAGARLALVGLEPDRLAALASALGPAHTWAECDVTDGASLERAVAHAAAHLGGIDVVVANAGIAPFGAVATTPPDALVRVIEVNFGGVVRTVSATLPHVTATRGYYLLVASASSFLAAPGLAVYAGTKSAVEHFGRTLAYEVAHRGIAVGTVHPCWIDTDLVRDARAEVAGFERFLADLPPPLSHVTSVEACAAAMRRAIERRAATTYVPGLLGPFAWARHALMRPPFDWLTRRAAARFVPQIEEQAGRTHAFGAHSVERTRGARTAD